MNRLEDNKEMDTSYYKQVLQVHKGTLSQKAVALHRKQRKSRVLFLTIPLTSLLN